ASTADGTKTIDLLRQKAIDSLVAIKVQEKMLTERNLWPYSSYQEFLTDLKNYNANRRQIAANGQVLYGPIEFDEQTFFDYRFHNALIQLKQRLVAEDIITITQEDLEKKFKKMQESVYQKERYTLQAYTRQVRDAYIEDAYAVLIGEYTTKAKSDIDTAKMKRITLNN